MHDGAIWVNPVTGAYVCDCSGQASGDPAFIITKNCEKQDVDECSVNNGGCAENAVCVNKDGLEGQGSHECKCPPGMIGDGIRRCDIYLYETQMVFEVVGLKSQNVNVQVNWGGWRFPCLHDSTIIH
jgi:hypothetical protein